MKSLFPTRCPWLIAIACLAGGCAVYSSGDDLGDGGDGGGGVEPVIGRPCAEVDCGAGYQCYVNAPGGYCLFEEPDECLSDQDCPDGTVCAPRELSQRVGHCLRACSAASDCRSGYQCRLIWLFPTDEYGPVSSSPVCWIPCVPGLDQMCNDDPLISSLHGSCQDDGTCLCHSGFEVNPLTGRCL